MLGIVCHLIDDSGNNTTGNRSLQLGRFRSGQYAESAVRDVYVHNANALEATLHRVLALGVGLFRMTSDLLPLADVVPEEWWRSDQVAVILARCGQFVRSNGMRVTFHPGQFCVLGSPRQDVVTSAVRELETHASIMDMMGLDESPQWAINVHAGSRDSLSRLADVIPTLRPGIRRRLTLENCESVASVAELQPVSQATGVPIVLDSHHHTFRDGGLDLAAACRVASATWPSGVKPLQHISNTTPGLEGGSFTDRRKHSDYIHRVPFAQLRLITSGEVDVEVEAKAKNQAVLRMAREMGCSLK